METAVFKLEGMDCACEGSVVEKRVKKLRGVETFALNAFTNQLKVSFDPAAVTVQDIQKSVEKAGVKAVPVEEAGAVARPLPLAGNQAPGGCCG
jgi:Cu+-exporting ATPase